MGRFAETDVSVEDIREGYIYGRLSERELDRDPFKQFELWFQQALDAGVSLPDAMTLATVDASGRPSARIVGLRGFDRRGFAFYTNYGSQKAVEMSANPQVAAVFHWAEQGRQVRVAGTVERMTPAESAEYFHTRDRESQLAAWASDQSRPIESRGALEAKLRQYTDRFMDEAIPLPENWGGYRIVPDCFEFWQGREFRLHDRFRFTQQEDGSWLVERLAP
jgi:pyridoxamine 5'-phosphate oxidase